MFFYDSWKLTHVTTHDTFSLRIKSRIENFDKYFLCIISESPWQNATLSKYQLWLILYINFSNYSFKIGSQTCFVANSLLSLSIVCACVSLCISKNPLISTYRLRWKQNNREADDQRSSNTWLLFYEFQWGFKWLIFHLSAFPCFKSLAHSFQCE